MKLTKKAYTVKGVDYQEGEIRTQVVVRTSAKRAIRCVKAQLGELADYYEFSVTEVRTVREYCQEELAYLAGRASDLSERLSKGERVPNYAFDDLKWLADYICELSKQG